MEALGFGHKYFSFRKNLATPARLFFLLEKHDSAFQIPTHAKQFACSPHWRRWDLNPGAELRCDPTAALCVGIFSALGINPCRAIVTGRSRSPPNRRLISSLK